MKIKFILFITFTLIFNLLNAQKGTLSGTIKDGEINDGITTNILSGVKQLSYLSRSVMMTAYSPEIQAYVYKILKVGSAKLNEY